jgi:hypothetical protein
MNGNTVQMQLRVLIAQLLDTVFADTADTACIDCVIDTVDIDGFGDCHQRYFLSVWGLF